VLLDYCVKFGTLCLRDQGGFLPFGAYILIDGSLATAGASNGEEHPEPQDLIEVLADGFTKEAREGNIRASAICFDGLAAPDAKSEKVDALICEMEHRDWHPMSIAVPYRVLDDGIKLDNATAATLKAKVFTSAAADRPD